MKTKNLCLAFLCFFSIGLFAIQPAKKILYLTNPAKIDGANALVEQPYINALTTAGFDVTTDYTTPFNLSSWGTYDLIIVGRTCASGNFTDVAAWANVSKPIITINPYILRTDRLKFINKTGQEMVQLTAADPITKAMVMDITDNAFNGIVLPSQKLDFYTGIYEHYNLLYSDWVSSNNGKLLAYVTGDVTNPDSEGRIIAARWKPGVETYTGSGNTPVAYRSFISFGAEYTINTVSYVNWVNNTSVSLNVLINEAKYLTSPDALTENKLSGTIIGTLTAESGHPAEHVFDGDFSTFFDSKTGTDGWVGYDLGTARTISTIKMAPRHDQNGRLNGAKFQGANTADFSDAVDLHVVAADANLPSNTLTVAAIDGTTPYRYVRYLATGTWSFVNIAEIAFYTRSVNVPLTGLALPSNTGNVTVGLELTLAPIFTPENASNKIIAWTSDNTDKATVNNLGVVFGVSPGTAVITGVSSDGTFSVSTTITVNAVVEAGTKLTLGTIIGTNDKEKAFDGNLSTFTEGWVDGSPASGAWFGMDFIVTKLVNKIKICPRNGWAGRLGGGRIEASSDAAFTNPVLLYETPNNLADNKLTTVLLPNTTKYRYYRYLAGEWSYGNLAELEFWNVPAELPENKLSGVVIGTLAAENGHPAEHAFDGDFSTFFDSKTAIDGWVGYDLGIGRTISSVKIAPRDGQNGRMNGAKLQAANVADFSDAVDLHVVANDANLAPNVLTVVPVNGTTPYRYVRYLATGAWSFVNVAEIEFYSRSVNVPLTALALPSTTGNVTVGLELALAPIFTPETATNRIITWTSDNTDKATVNNFGVVFGVAPGTAVITGVSNDGSFSVSTTITVDAVAEAGTKLTVGTIIGTHDKEKAFDGNLSTFTEGWIDGTPALGAWFGMDFIITKLVNKIKICPRNGWAARLGNGRIEASTDVAFTSPVLLYETPNNLPDNKLTTVLLENTTKYRYYRYLAGADSYGNLAELEFWNVPVTPTALNSVVDKTVTLYPNPLVSGDAKLILNGFENEKNIKISLVDMTGKVIMSKSVIGNTALIKRATLASGLYSVCVTSDNFVKNFKLSVR